MLKKYNIIDTLKKSKNVLDNPKAGGVVVESGIGSGDEIIISGQHKVCEGSAVSL